MRVGLHSANSSSQPMEELLIDFVGLLTRTKRGNLAILVIVDAFSKFVFFCPVWKISSQIVSDCLERSFFPAYGTPVSIGLIMPGSSVVNRQGICVFDGVLPTSPSLPITRRLRSRSGSIVTLSLL